MLIIALLIEKDFECNLLLFMDKCEWEGDKCFAILIKHHVITYKPDLQY